MSASAILALLAALCLVLFWRLNAMTPFQHDDYAGAFVYGPDPRATVRPTDERIDSIRKVAESVANGYLTVNGRLTPQALMALFAFVGKRWFDLANTGIAAVMVIGLLGLSGTRLRRQGAWGVAAFAEALWWVVPFPGQTVFWLSGAICYFWPTAFCVVLVRRVTGPRRSGRREGRGRALRIGGVVGVSAAIAMTQESIVAGVLPTLAMFSWRRWRRLDAVSLAAIAGFAIGSLGMFLAPGTRRRAVAEGLARPLTIQSAAIRLLDSLAMFRSLRVLPVLVVAFLVCGILRPWRVRRVLAADWTSLAVVGCAGLFALLLGNSGERIGFGLSVFALVIVLDLAWEAIASERAFRVAVFVVGVATAFDYVRAASAIARQARVYETMISGVEAGNEVVLAEQLPRDRFVLGAAISPDPQDFHNRLRALFHGTAFMSGLDPATYRRIVAEGAPCDASTPGAVLPRPVGPPLCPVEGSGLLVGRMGDGEVHPGRLEGEWRRVNEGAERPSRGILRRWFGTDVPPTSEVAQVALLPLAGGTFLLVSPPSGTFLDGGRSELFLAGKPSAPSAPAEER